jgi:hypothetical protein
LSYFLEFLLSLQLSFVYFSFSSDLSQIDCQYWQGSPYYRLRAAYHTGLSNTTKRNILNIFNPLSCNAPYFIYSGFSKQWKDNGTLWPVDHNRTARAGCTGNIFLENYNYPTPKHSWMQTNETLKNFILVFNSKPLVIMLTETHQMEYIIE